VPERRTHLGHDRRVERCLAIDGGKAGRFEQSVTLSQRDLEVLGERQHHLAARLRAPRLDEAQVSRRDACFDGEIELAHAA
jgi:hypothetical protein